MNLYLFHSVNCGLFLWNGRTGLMVDFFHGGREQGFSDMPPSLHSDFTQGAGLFAHSENILFTHLHPDHFAPQYLPLPPALRSSLLYGPTLSCSNVSPRPVVEGAELFELNGYQVLSLHTVHDGPRFRHCPHRAYLIHAEGESIFVAGDTLFSGEDILRGIEGFFHGLSAAFLNPYQLLSPGGREFLFAATPSRIFLYHLPFAEDDVTFCRSLARQALRQLPAGLPAVEVLPPMSWLDGKAPHWAATNSPSSSLHVRRRSHDCCHSRC